MSQSSQTATLRSQSQIFCNRCPATNPSPVTSPLATRTSSTSNSSTTSTSVSCGTVRTASPGVSVDYAAKYGLTPAVSGQGFPSLGSFGPAGFAGVGYGIGNAAVQIDQNFLLGNDLTWTHGSHLFQFGIDIRRIQSSQYDLSGLTGGRYAFNANSVNGPLGAGSSLGAFILGNIGAYTNTPQSVPGYYRWHYYAAYFQDDWHVTRNFTLNLGLRYEVETPRV